MRIRFIEKADKKNAVTIRKLIIEMVAPKLCTKILDEELKTIFEDHQMDRFVYFVVKYRNEILSGLYIFIFLFLILKPL